MFSLRRRYSVIYASHVNGYRIAKISVENDANGVRFAFQNLNGSTDFGKFWPSQCFFTNSFHFQNFLFFFGSLKRQRTQLNWFGWRTDNKYIHLSFYSVSLRRLSISTGVYGLREYIRNTEWRNRHYTFLVVERRLKWLASVGKKINTTFTN